MKELVIETLGSLHISKAFFASLSDNFVGDNFFFVSDTGSCAILCLGSMRLEDLEGGNYMSVLNSLFAEYGYDDIDLTDVHKLELY